jgi:hypothetical protein
MAPLIGFVLFMNARVEREFQIVELTGGAVAEVRVLRSVFGVRTVAEAARAGEGG